MANKSGRLGFCANLLKRTNFVMTKLFVTGIAGHTAKYFLQRLAQEGWNEKIICPVRPMSAYKTRKIEDYGLDIDFIECDLSGDLSALASAMKNTDTVLHIANIRYSERVVEAGVIAGVDWFICVHTTGRYSRFKMASADYIKIEDGLIGKYQNLTILRPTLIYGSSGDRNMWRQIKAIDKNLLFPIIGTGKNLFQPVHAKDLGNAYFDVIRCRNQVFGKQYNLPGCDEVEYAEILRYIARNLQTKVLLIPVPIWLTKIAVIMLSLVPDRLFRCPISFEQVLRMQEDKVFPYDKAREDFGYSPMKFKDGIKIEVEEYIRARA